MKLSKEELIFHDDDTITFTMTARGVPSCSFEIEKAPDWLNLVSLIKTKQENEVEITLASSASHSLYGVINEELWIWSCLGRTVVPIQLNISSELAYSLPDTISFMRCDDSLTLEMENLGVVPIEFDIILPDKIHSDDAQSGSFLPGDNVQLKMTLDRSGIQEDTYETEIQVTTNEILNKVHVQIESYLDNRVMIREGIIDAEYNRNRDIMVMVCTGETALLCYDLSSDTIIQMDLSYQPTCITIAPNGNTAVVGHDGWLTHIDLLNMSVRKEIPTSFIAYDMALSAANWVYVTPKYGQWTTLRCFDLNEAEPLELEHLKYESIYQYSRIRLHPNGDYVYTFYNGFIDKFDISNGIADHIMNSNMLHYTSGGDAWFSRDGLKFYCMNRNVLNYSDMALVGTIPVEEDNVVNSPSIRGLDHARSRNEIYIIAWTHSEDCYRPVIYVHDAKKFSYKRSYSLQQIQYCSSGEAGTLLNAYPKFVFINKDEDLLMVLCRSCNGSPDVPWVIEQIPLL